MTWGWGVVWTTGPVDEDQNRLPDILCVLQVRTTEHSPGASTIPRKLHNHTSSSPLPSPLPPPQVCLEGEISKQSAARNRAAGNQPTGDLIPWTISQQFQDAEFPSLSGARIVRIAVHPDVVRVRMDV